MFKRGAHAVELLKISIFDGSSGTSN